MTKNKKAQSMEEIDEQYEVLPTVRFERFMDNMAKKLSGELYDGYSLKFDFKMTVSANGLDPFLKVMLMAPMWRRHFLMVLVLKEAIEELYEAEELNNNILYQSFLETIPKYKDCYWDEDAAIADIEREAANG